MSYQFYTAYLPNGRVVAAFTSDEASLAANTPAGCSVLVGQMLDAATHYINDNGQPTAFPPRADPKHTWDWATKTWQDTRTLSQVKAEKWAEIKVTRDAAIWAPKATSVGIFDADPESQNNLNKVISLVKVAVKKGYPGVANYTLANNERVSLTLDEFETAGFEIGAQVQAIFDQADGLRTQIENAATAAEVEAIQW